MLQTHQPDDLRCVRCGAPAAGPCATCRAMICGDCAELTGGAVQKVAVCVACHRKGRGTLNRRAWWWVARWPLAFVTAIAALGVALRACG